MAGLLQYHRLKDNEPLHIPLSVLHPMQLDIQSPDKATPNLSPWSISAAIRHNRKVTPPLLPHCVVRDASIDMVTCVGVHPFPVYLLESEVLRGWSVTQQVSLLPLPVPWFQQ